MILNVHITTLTEHKISANGYLFCLAVYHNRSDLLHAYIGATGKFKMDDLIRLINDGWIKVVKEDAGYIFSNLKTTDKFQSLLIGVKVQLNTTDQWVKEWYNLFPKGVKSGGYYVKSDLSGCIKRMKKFQAQHPEFSQQTILNATKNYIENCAKKGYQYMKIAPYFIEKDGVSMLAGECDALSDNLDNYTNEFSTQL